MIFKMIVLLCSLSNYNNCNETNAIAIDRLSRVAPYAARCEHDSQHEAAQLLYKYRDTPNTKIKILCIESK